MYNNENLYKAGGNGIDLLMELKAASSEVKPFHNTGQARATANTGYWRHRCHLQRGR